MRAKPVSSITTEIAGDESTRKGSSRNSMRIVRAGGASTGAGAPARGVTVMPTISPDIAIGGLPVGDG